MFFLLFKILKYKSHKMYYLTHFQSNTLMELSALTILYSCHHHNPSLEFFCLAKLKLGPLRNASHSSLPWSQHFYFQPSQKWNYSFTFLWLVSFTFHDVVNMVQLFCGMCQLFFLVSGWIVCHCMHIPYFTHQWTLGWLPHSESLWIMLWTRV